MKTISTLLAFLFLVVTSNAQAPENEIKTDEGTVATELPAVVIKKVGEDFSIYLPETENTDGKINYIQNTFIAYDLGKDLEGYENYFVTLKIKDATLLATYNENGKLINVVEKYKNVRLPKEVVTTVTEQFPGWKITKDSYSYSQEDGSITKQQYVVILKKNKKIKRVTLNSKGVVLKQ